MRLDSGVCAMGVQDESDMTMSKTISIAGNNQVKGDTQSETLVQSKYTSSSLKVRKPYTITKQREKWTEEEHQKFLEALKLYGRGWRQIEEHVGTKTAVQIRSHAQKFFSKLERESNGIIESPNQSIVIPPPRHKRKPLHPYPRKPVDYSHGRSNLNARERPPSPYLLVAQRETHSPTSVLSRVDSDSYESAIPEQTVRSLSPSSCHTEMHSMSKSHIEKNNDCMTLKSSEEAKSHWLSVSQSGGASLENLYSLKFESNSKGTKSSIGTSADDQPSTGIKLFGRTISVSNVENPLRFAVEDLKSVSCMHSQGNHVVDKEKLGLELQPHLDVHLSLGMSCSNSNSTRGGENMNSMEDQKEMLFTVGSVAKVSLPGWTFQQGLSTLNSEPCNKFEFPTPLHARLMERIDFRKGTKESSFTCSSSRSICELRNGDKKFAGDSENQELNNEASIGAEESLKSVGISPRKSTGGFVPYKRCLSEIADSLGSALEERKGQRARVCS